VESDDWTSCPFDGSAYDYSPDRLLRQWPRLHQGDREPAPSVDNLRRLENTEGAAAGLEDRAALLQDAWRAFHRGEYRRARDAGKALEGLGLAVASKAQATYSHYLEPDGGRKQALLLEAADWARQLSEKYPDYTNGHYYRAFALGRAAQLISATEALSRGLAGTVKDSLDEALRLEPDHADAHTALGTWHTTVIDKVGGLLGGIAYHADRDEAVVHFRRGIELAPESASAHTEYADGLLTLFGKRRLEEARELYERAAGLTPFDALSRLDVDLAKEELGG
jgi:tetratricopeptide (TPR) repeat protein